MFESIEIKNFRGIKNLAINNLKPINLIIGKNSTCKSTILESIFINCFPSNVETIFKANSTRNYNLISTESLKSFFYKCNTKENIVFNVKHSNKQECSINIDFQYIPNSIDASMLNFKINFNKNIQFENKAVFNNKKMSFYSAPYEEGSMGVFFMHCAASWIFEIPIGLERVILRKETDKLVKVLQILEPSVKNILLGDNKHIYIDCGLENLLPLNYFGTSFISLLAILVYIISIPQGAVLIDNIDFLSVEFRDIVLANILRLTKEYNNQLFITSNNQELHKSIMILTSKISMSDSLRILKCDKKNDDQISISYLK